MSTFTHRHLISGFFLLLLVFGLNAQSCQELHQSDSNCECLPGLTGPPSCNTLACGNPFIASSKRAALNPDTAGDSGSKGCQKQCTEGFTGLACNICQNSKACQSALSSLSSGSSTANPLASSASQDMMCSTEAVAYGVNFGVCEVENPMLSSLFPGKISATIQRNADPSSAPLPSAVLSVLSAETAVTQIWYSPNSSVAAQEQFFCTGWNCTQEIDKGVDIYRCGAIQCRCIPGTTLCGSAGGIDLTSTIASLKGRLSFECAINNSTTTSCNLITDALVSLFGPKGFALNSCGFGECIPQSVAEMKRKLLYHQDSSKLSTGLIVGLVIILLILLAFIALVLFGFRQQHRARHPVQPSSSLGPDGAARVVWSDLRYVLSPKGSSTALRRFRRSPTRAPGTFSSPRPRATSVASMSTYDRARADEKSPSAKSLGSLGSPAALISNHPPKYDRLQPKQILRGLSGSVEPGTMMAILGPSGAGKSTFLDILAGQRKAGQVTGSHSISLADGTTISPLGHEITVGFVDQADIVPATSTVREALNFAGKLKLPEDVSDEAREVRVAEVIELLGLSHVAHSKIGNDEVRGLSGGERRRLSIGLELINAPSILFLDEPTSGLDSVSAMRVVNVLKGLSTNAPSGCGTTIVCSIHQPSSQIYHAFDYICLLALGGRQVFCGKTEDVTGVLSSHGLHCPQGYNIADYLLEVASEPPENLLKQADAITKDSESYPASIQSAPSSLLANSRPRTTTMTQFQCLAKRDWNNLKRDPSLFWSHAAIAIVTGVFVGAMYFQAKVTIAGFQNRIGSLFFLGAIIAFSALSALNNFLHVRLLFMRERASNYYSPAAWLLSRLCFDLIPLRLIPAVAMSIIVYFMVGLNPEAGNVLKFLLIIMELNIVQTLYNFLLAALFAQGGLAILLASLTNLFQLAFAGFFVNLSTMTPVLKWIQYLAPLKFSLEAVSVNEVGGGLMIKDNIQGVNIQISAATIMDLLFGFKSDGYWRDVIVLFGFTVALTVFLIMAVYLKLRQTR